MKKFLCKDVLGKNIYWDPSGFARGETCKQCKFTQGECPNKYITKDDGPALYCEWYQKEIKNEAI